MHMRNTLIMAVILVLLGGFVYFFEIRGRAEREAAEHEAELLVHFEPEQVTGLTLDTADGTVVASRSDGHWSIQEPRPVPADGEALDTLVDSLHTATQERVIAESPEDLATFGLAQPGARVTLRLDDDSDVSLAVGKDTPVGFNLYAMAGDGKVYSAPRALRDKVTKSLLDLRDRGILAFDEAQVRRLRVQTDGYTAELKLDDPEGDDGGTWMLSAPVEARADDDTISDLLDDLGSGQAEAFVLDDAPGDEELSRYGLDSPHASLTLWTADDASQRLVIGAESEDPAGRYAMREGGSSVFVVAADVVDALPATVDALRNRQVLTVGRERIRAVEIEDAQGTRRIERDGSDWKITAPRALDADASAVSRLLGSLTGLRAEGFADAGPADADLRIGLGIAPAGDAEGAEGEPIEITIGSRTTTAPAADGDADDETVTVRRLRISGDDAVYLVPDDDVDELRVDTFALRDKTLVEFTQPDLTGIEVTAADGTTYRLQRDGDAWTSSDGAEAGKSAEDLLWDLNYLRMAAVAVEWPSGQVPDLAPYGLDHPRYRIVASTADGVVADVAIGAEAAPPDDEGSGRVFVRVDGTNGVYEVGASLADAVTGLVEALTAP